MALCQRPSVACRTRSAAGKARPAAPRPAALPDRCQSGEQDVGGLAKAVTAAAVVVALAGNVGAARAAAAADETDWKPRRHHRHIGERFSDTWADAVVETQETDKQTIRDLTRRLTEERERANEEAARRRAAEQRVRSLQAQVSSRAADEDALLSIRVLGAELTGPLTFALLAAAGWHAWRTDLWGRLSGRAGLKGRWVYDRSLGGRKVWIPASPDGAAGDGKLPDHMSDADFSELTAIAAAKAAGGAGASSSAAAASAAYEPPAWWDRPGFVPVSGEDEKAARRADAERILRRIEAAKNRGEDYELADILALRAACTSAGGASLEARTVGARDAIYRAAVDAGVRACLEPGSVDLGGYPPLRLAAGVASDVGLPEQRAVPMLQGAVAGACRARVVDAIANLEKGDDLGALLSLSRLSSLLDGMPVLNQDSSEVQLVAEELNSWAPVAQREKILTLVAQVDEAHAELVARMLDLRPEDALPRVRAALKESGGGGGGGGGGTGGAAAA